MNTSQPTPCPAAIVFDLGGVLIDWNPRYLYRRFFPDDPQAMERFLAEIHFSEWNVVQDAGRPFAEAIPEKCAEHPAYAELIRAYDTCYEETVGGPIQPVVEILGALRQAGYPLYALSNWPQETFVRVRPKYAFFEWFDQIFISGEVKLVKPDARFYHWMLARIGRGAGECIFIDDSPVNIAAAERLGFQTVLFRSAEQLRAELEQRGIQVDRTIPPIREQK
ncbi:MAG TPA: HAD family phosphatase [Anaerolineaceae bacterium]